MNSLRFQNLSPIHKNGFETIHCYESGSASFSFSHKLALGELHGYAFAAPLFGVFGSQGGSELNGRRAGRFFLGIFDDNVATAASVSVQPMVVRFGRPQQFIVVSCIFAHPNFVAGMLEPQEGQGLVLLLFAVFLTPCFPIGIVELARLQLFFLHT